MIVIRLTRHQAFRLFLISMMLPTQYFLSKYTGNDTEVSRLTSINSMLNGFKAMREWDGKMIVKTMIKFLHKIDFGRRTKEVEKVEESIALEVFRLRNKNGDFAFSAVVRVPHPEKVKFRVGQIVRHKSGYRGVIIGWDDTCRAPKRWMSDNYPDKTQKWLASQAHYLLLLAGEASEATPTKRTYVAEVDLELEPRSQSNTVQNSELDDFFDFYDGMQYHMRPAMRILYPED